jgi:hypothetical protein
LQLIEIKLFFCRLGVDGKNASGSSLAYSLSSFVQINELTLTK